MKIVTVQPEENQPRQYRVQLDNDHIISIHEDVVVKKGLIPGKALDGEELEKIIEEDQQAKVKDVALRQLARRSRSEHELRVFLQKKGYPWESIDKTIRLLKEKGLLNDRRFAEQWVQARLRSKGKGRLLLKLELEQKGIEPDIIETVINRVSEEEELDACYTLALKKLRLRSGSEPHLLTKKLYAALIRRGFAPETVAQVIQQVMGTDQGEEF